MASKAVLAATDEGVTGSAMGMRTMLFRILLARLQNGISGNQPMLPDPRLGSYRKRDFSGTVASFADSGFMQLPQSAATQEGVPVALNVNMETPSNWPVHNRELGHRADRGI